VCEGSPELRRPKPDLRALSKTQVDLRAIVTHPPVLDASAAADGDRPAV